MCYSPGKQSTMTISLALKRIEEGEFEKAERLLEVARTSIGPVMNNLVKGHTIGDWYWKARKDLAEARKGQL